MSKTPNIDIMNSFTLKSIPNLDVCVLAALELFSSTKIPRMKIPYEHPLIVGSGNAIATGKIIFRDRYAVFGDESSFEEKLKKIKEIDGVVLLSASGGKHAPVIAKAARKCKKHVTLITNTPDSIAHRYLDMNHKYDEYVFPKNREPYTYNTSTYMGMLLGHTKEDPTKILKFIKRKIDRLKLPDFRKYKKYYLVVPEEFEGIIRMLNIKFIELFGRNIARDIETFENVKHATTLVPSKELFITFGRKYKEFGENHLYVPLPKKSGYVAMMAIGYYIIGKIQAAHPAWFKRNVEEYTRKVSRIFRSEIKAIVE